MTTQPPQTLQCPPGINANSAQEWVDQNEAEASRLLGELRSSLAKFNTAFDAFRNALPDLASDIENQPTAVFVGLGIGPFDINQIIPLTSGGGVDLVKALNDLDLRDFGGSASATASPRGTIDGEIFRRYKVFERVPTLRSGNWNPIMKAGNALSSGSNDYRSGFSNADESVYGILKTTLENVKTARDAAASFFKPFIKIKLCVAAHNAGIINATGGVSLNALNLVNQRSNLNLTATNNLTTTTIGAASPLTTTIQNAVVDFKEQCFLLAHIFKLAKIKERLDHGVSTVRTINPDGYKELPDVNDPRNRTVLVSGEPFGIVNTLTQSPNKNLFFEMTNEQISTLQPKIRLFKVVPTNPEEQTDCKEKEVEIVFDPYDLEHDVTRMFSPDMGVRGIGVGLKSFNFSYEADNPFAIKKSISAKLVIHANNFTELLTTRYNSSEEYSYIDLALRTGGADTITFSGAKSQVHVNNLDKLNFKLKAVVGWQVPVADRGLFGQDLLDAIYDSSISINLTPTVHMFDIDDSGRVTFTINYLAYAEDYFDNANFNIFTEPDIFINSIIRNIVIDGLNIQIDREGAVDDSEASKKKKEYVDQNEQTIKDEKESSLRFLMKSMIKKVYFIKFDQQDAFLYGLNQPYGQAAAQYPTVEDLEKKIKPVVNISGSAATQISTQTNVSAQAIQSGTQTNTEDIIPVPSEAIVNFFYAADIIDIILQNIEDSLDLAIAKLNNAPDIIQTITNSNPDIVSLVGESTLKCLINDEHSRFKRLLENYHKLRIMLGPLEISKPDSFEYEVRNLGDVPVSVRSFLEFLTTKMINLEKPQYYLTKFINDFFNEFVVNLLNRDVCYNGKAAQRLFLHQNAFTEYRDNLSDQDTITKYCNDPNVGAGDPFNVKCPSSVSSGLGLPGSRAATAAGFTQSSTSTCTKRLYLKENGAPNPGLPVPVLNIMGVRNDPRSNPGICLEYNYLFFYAGRSIPMNQMVGCKHPYTKQNSQGQEQFGCFNSKGEKVGETGDHSRGIWHYQIGKDRGIVKTISLSKTDSTGLAEVRYEQEGYDGLKQLRVLYDVTIKSYLDISAFPGNYIYVEPRGFDIGAQTPDGIDLTQIGIGGYHMIYKTEHTISPGTAETTIHAKWVASNSPSREIAPPPAGNNPPAKCSLS